MMSSLSTPHDISNFASIKLKSFGYTIADFLGEEVVQRHMNGAGRASLLRRIQAASKNDMELDHALKAYGAGYCR